ncbi:transcriptional regulator [Streptomyces roseus]|uniref:Transcriptional regulator n=1 Tax=Streptomyces roseus TaxID=66430 RepID=A0A0J6XLC6_9ACTN|nr:transcriptional regulator [Streptomyces roseus]
MVAGVGREVRAVSDSPYRLTTGAVARRLGVSPTTLRSWDRRYGIGPSVREGGRHRRWAPEDIAMLEEMCRLTTSGVPPAEAAGAALSRAGRPPDASSAPAPAEPAPQPADSVRRGRSPGSGNGLPLGEVRYEFRGLARAAVRLDGPTMDRLLTELVAAHGLVTGWEEVMAPTLHAVGRKWESTDERYVEVEHLLSWHISTALRRIASSPATSSEAAPVLLSCVPGEQHTLPLEALAAGLAERGLPMRMLGADVPAGALNAAVRRMGPSAVVLWSQSRHTASPALARMVANTGFGIKGARTRPLVVLAGPGWANRPAAPGMLCPAGLREALDVIGRHCRTSTS